MLDGLNFNSSVQNKEADNIGEKIDTDDVSDDIREQQDKALTEINEFNNDLTADTSGEEDSESEEDEEEDKSDDEADESDEDEDDDSEEDESETDDETDQKVSDYKGFADKDAYIAHLEALATGQKKESDTRSDEDKEHDEVASFIKEHSEILPASVLDNYDKFFKSGNDAYLRLDNRLSKLVDTLSTKVNPTLPIQERLNIAYQIAFADELQKKSEKITRVKTELRTQIVGKSVGQPVNGADGSPKRSAYSQEQLNVAKKWGVKLK